MKSWKFTVMAVSAAGLLGAGIADAASVRVRCETRSNRSKISVDGAGLPAGAYRAIATSGSNKKASGSQNAVGGEAEFDFDSARNDIAAGATPISPTFIQGGKVTGKIVNSANRVVVQATVSCRVR
jgi:hypothetical protein